MRRADEDSSTCPSSQHSNALRASACQQGCAIHRSTRRLASSDLTRSRLRSHVQSTMYLGRRHLLKMTERPMCPVPVELIRTSPDSGSQNFLAICTAEWGLARRPIEVCASKYIAARLADDIATSSTYTGAVPRRGSSSARRRLRSAHSASVAMTGDRLLIPKTPSGTLNKLGRGSVPLGLEARRVASGTCPTTSHSLQSRCRRCRVIRSFASVTRSCFHRVQHDLRTRVVVKPLASFGSAAGRTPPSPP